MTAKIKTKEFTFTAELAGPDDGELVILLHGFPQTNHAWRAEVSALSEIGYRACAYNQRGYSEGARPEGIDSYRMEFIVSDVFEIADALGADQFHLVGHDWGGQIAWCAAATQPERIKTLSVISRPHPRAFIKAMAEDTEQPKKSTHHRSHLRPEMTDEMLANGAALWRRGLHAVPPKDIDAYEAVVANREALDAALNWYRAVPLSNLKGSAIPAVVVPTLYVWGTVDGTVGRAAAEGTKEWVDAPYRFVQLPDVGHFVTDQAPGQFTPLLIEHLRSCELESHEQTNVISIEERTAR